MTEKAIDAFIGIYPKLNTKKNYRSGIYTFLDYIYGSVRAGKVVKEHERAKYEDVGARYLAEERDYLNDLIGFIGNMNGKPPATIKIRVTAVKEWLNFHGVEFSQRELKTLRHRIPRAKGAWTVESEYDTEVLKKILAHTDEKGSALLLTLASSGMRIGEALNIKLNDVDLTADPPEIIVRGEYTKSEETRVVFISKEAKAAVDEWLNVRDAYLRAALNKTKGFVKKVKVNPKKETDDRLFPFSDGVVRELWGRALTKAGLDGKDTSTGRLKYRVHGLRKFFRSQLALSCPLDIVEALMGHEGYLTNAYRRYTRKQMGEYYLKAEHHVTVMGTGDLTEIRETLEDTRAAVKGYKDIITEQAEEMVDIRRDIEALKAKEEARTPFDEKMTDLMERLLRNPEMEKLIKKEIEAINEEKQ
jgi:integrase